MHKKLITALKRKVAARVWRSLKYWAVDVEKHDMEMVIESYRKTGMKIGRGVVIYETIFDAVYPDLITIGDHVTVTGAVILAHDDSPVLWLKRRVVSPVKIGSYVFIGYGSVILPGVSVGSGAIIGAGSVVTRDVPEDTVVAGNPARIIRARAEYLSRITQRRSLIPYVVNGNLVRPDESEAIRALAAEMLAVDGVDISQV